MKREKLLVSISVISVVIILFAILIGLFSAILSNNLSKKEIFSLVEKNEELLRSVLVEITESQPEIKYISTTQKTRIYNPDYVNLEGLYIIRDNGIYERITNDVLQKAMNIKGLCSISVRNDIVEFSCGGRGFGSASSYYGFSYTVNENTMSSRGFIPEGNGWLLREENGDNWYYTERIVDGFYYYEENY